MRTCRTVVSCAGWASPPSCSSLVAGLLVVGVVVWQRLDRTDLEEALDRVPASSLRVGFTDWAAVRSRLEADLGDTPDGEQVETLIQKAYDSDYGAASSIDDSAPALQENFGFSPATAQWEAFAQGREGATMVLKVADGADFDVLADNLRSAGYKKPKEDDGVWEGGADLMPEIDPTISPELQYVTLLEDQGLVVSSDDGRATPRRRPGWLPVTRARSRPWTVSPTWPDGSATRPTR